LKKAQAALDREVIKLREQVPHALALVDRSVAGNVRVFGRGQYLNQEEEVPRGSLGMLHDGRRPRYHEGSGRLSLARELTDTRNPLTARVIDAEEAKRIGLVSEVCEDVEARAMALAMMLASKSPLAVRGTKRVLLRARDEPDVARGLNYVATHNAAMLMSDDLNESLKARFEKRAPVYSKL